MNNQIFIFIFSNICYCAITLWLYDKNTNKKMTYFYKLRSSNLVVVRMSLLIFNVNKI